MANSAYMRMTDDKGELIQGGSEVSGREHWIEVFSFEHELRIPTDEDTGALTSTRKHGPFVITKDFDSATPILNKACASGQTLESVSLSWYRINEMGAEVEYFRHTLSKVKVVSVRPVVIDVKDKANEHLGHRERIALRYQKIRWTYVEGNIETEDDWSARAGG